jgi:epoxide hydrolase 4
MTETTQVQDIEDRVEHGYVDNDGVKIHYATLGSGPLVVMIHGFPDFWYTWRAQMDVLSKQFQTVAIDQRGYNLSDKPAGGESYRLRYMVSDVAAVIRHFGQKRAIIIGHDWGGMVAWQFAINLPAMTEKLIVLNLPHPQGFARELAHNIEQQTNSAYARNYQQEGAHTQLSAEKLTAWVKEPQVRARYVEAMERSDFEAMLHYYKQNYPREPYQESPNPSPKIQASVLQIHGLEDKFLLASALSGTWEWIEQDYTLVTIPHAGHFVQYDAADLVSRTIYSWLNR